MNWTSQPAKTVDYSTLPLEQLLLVKKADVSEADFIVIRDRLLTEWQSYQKILSTAKTDEMKLRNAVVGFVTDPKNVKGTENIDLGQGWKLKAIKAQSYSFVKGDDGKIDEGAIDRAVAKLGKLENGRYLAEKLISYTPSFSLSTYKELTPEMKKIIDPILIIGQSAAKLEIVPPKGEI